MSTGSTFDPQQALSQPLELISPVTEECFLRVPEASEADVDHAVRSDSGLIHSPPT
jgi:acyl-CoA reductase-like NAD-dependent aldehyde dehydrogenase